MADEIERRLEKLSIPKEDPVSPLAKFGGRAAVAKEKLVEPKSQPNIRYMSQSQYNQYVHFCRQRNMKVDENVKVANAKPIAQSAEVGGKSSGHAQTELFTFQ